MQPNTSNKKRKGKKSVGCISCDDFRCAIHTWDGLKRPIAGEESGNPSKQPASWRRTCGSRERPQGYRVAWDLQCSQSRPVLHETCTVCVCCSVEEKYTYNNRRKIQTNLLTFIAAIIIPEMTLWSKLQKCPSNHTCTKYLQWKCGNVSICEESPLNHTFSSFPEKAVFRMSRTSLLASMSGGLATRAERQIALYYQSAYEYEMIIQWWPSSFSIQLCYSRNRLEWFITNHVWVRGQMSRKCNCSQSFRIEY